MTKDSGRRIAFNSLLLLISGCSARTVETSRAEASNMPLGPMGEQQVTIRLLEDRINHLNTLVPNQGAAMSQLGYYFSNLWFAIDAENWPLADFYLHECRETLEWAVRIKPVREDNSGNEVNIAGIAEAVDNTQFTQMDEAIRAKDKVRSITVYRDTMVTCNSCHRASDKPFLRARIPDVPQATTIIFDPMTPAEE